MLKKLSESPFIENIWPSEGNFLLIKVTNYDKLLVELNKFNIKIRDYRSSTGHLRISIGSPEDNNIALEAFGVIIEDISTDRIGEFHRKTKETDIDIQLNLDGKDLTWKSLLNHAIKNLLLENFKLFSKKTYTFVIYNL